MYIGHRKEILKLTFRALALRRNKSIRSNARHVIIVKGLCIKSRLRQSMSLNVAGSGKASLKIFEMIGLASSSHIFNFFFVFIFFLLFQTPIVKLWSSCAAPKQVMCQRVFQGASEFKVRNLIEWTGHFAIYVRWLLGWLYIFSLQSADEPQEGRNSCPLLRSCFIGSFHVGVSQCFSCSISLAVYILAPVFTNANFATMY